MEYGMAKLNRSKVLKAVNQSLAERGSGVRVRYNSEWKEYQVTYSIYYHRTFAPASSLVDAIEMALHIS
jgi:hypothetical protein